MYNKCFFPFHLPLFLTLKIDDKNAENVKQEKVVEVQQWWLKFNRGIKPDEISFKKHQSFTVSFSAKRCSLLLSFHHSRPIMIEAYVFSSS